MNQKPSHAALLGGELQASGGGERHGFGHVRDHGEEAALAQDVLGQRADLTGGRFDEDEATGRKTELPQPRHTEIGAGPAHPDERTRGAGQDGGDEAGRAHPDRAIGAGAHDFMHGPTAQPATKMGVDRGGAGRQTSRSMRGDRLAFDARHLLAQQRQGVVVFLRHVSCLRAPACTEQNTNARENRRAVRDKIVVSAPRAPERPIIGPGNARREASIRPATEPGFCGSARQRHLTPAVSSGPVDRAKGFCMFWQMFSFITDRVC